MAFSYRYLPMRVTVPAPDFVSVPVPELGAPPLTNVTTGTLAFTIVMQAQIECQVGDGGVLADVIGAAAVGIGTAGGKACGRVIAATDGKIGGGVVAVSLDACCWLICCWNDWIAWT